MWITKIEKKFLSH